MTTNDIARNARIDITCYASIYIYHYMASDIDRFANSEIAPKSMAQLRRHYLESKIILHNSRMRSALKKANKDFPKCMGNNLPLVLERYNQCAHNED